MSTLPLPAADWSDSNGKPDQNDGDGKQWHTDVPAAAQAADQPPPSTPAPPTASPIPAEEGPSREGKMGLFVGVLALLVILNQINWTLVIGAWQPGLLISIAIVIFGVTFVVRSDQSGARKAMFIIALVLALFAGPVAYWIKGFVF